MDALKGFSLWIPYFLPDHVREYCLSDMESIWRRNTQTIHQTVLDIPRAVGMGLYSRERSGLGCAVRFWLLQPHAYISADRTDPDGSVQTENMVQLLPDGDHDTADLPPAASQGES